VLNICFKRFVFSVLEWVFFVGDLVISTLANKFVSLCHNTDKLSYLQDKT